MDPSDSFLFRIKMIYYLGHNISRLELDKNLVCQHYSAIAAMMNAFGMSFVNKMQEICNCQAILKLDGGMCDTIIIVNFGSI